MPFMLYPSCQRREETHHDVKAQRSCLPSFLQCCANLNGKIRLADHRLSSPTPAHTLHGSPLSVPLSPRSSLYRVFPPWPSSVCARRSLPRLVLRTRLAYTLTPDPRADTCACRKCYLPYPQVAAPVCKVIKVQDKQKIIKSWPLQLRCCTPVAQEGGKRKKEKKGGGLQRRYICVRPFPLLVFRQTVALHYGRSRCACCTTYYCIHLLSMAWMIHTRAHKIQYWLLGVVVVVVYLLRKEEKKGLEQLPRAGLATLHDRAVRTWLTLSSSVTYSRSGCTIHRFGENTRLGFEQHRLHAPGVVCGERRMGK